MTEHFLITAFVLLLSSDVSEAQSPDRFEFSHPQMGTVFKIVCYADKEEIAAAAARRAFERVDTLNARYSDYLPESELNRLCARAGTGERVPISRDLWYILKQSEHYSKASAGAFDVSIGALSRLWRRARNLKTVPDSARISEALKTTDYRNILLDKRLRLFGPPRYYALLAQKGIQLDLGGIAQGYAADACLRMLRRSGIRRALADAGGDIALGDAPPGKSGWAIEIPAGDSAKKTLYLKNCGITTSGARFRYVEHRGLRYSHIIDPRTGWGLTNPRLVTVLAPHAMEADAWATALSVSGEEGWKKIEKKQPGLRVWFSRPQE
jgi:FAD:protein FMN transferase